MANYLIIGGSSGIGRKTAEMLADDNNNVIATYNSNMINDDKIKYIKYNVLDENAQLTDIPEKIDGLLYCPGSIMLKPFHRLKTKDFTDDYNLQIIGAVKVIQTVLKNLKNSNNASVVMFSTIAVQQGFNFHSLISSTKGAVEGLTRSLAAEFAPKIRVNAIAPSITNTEMSKMLLNTDSKIKANNERHPMKRIGSTEDIANAAKFLLQDTSDWMTGQILHVDGGLSSIKG